MKEGGCNKTVRNQEWKALYSC